MQAPASEREPTFARRVTPPGVRRPSKIRFVGALDASTVAGAQARIDALVETAPREVVVDLAYLERLDSAGVHALVGLYKRVRASGGSVVVVNASAQPRMVLELLKLNTIFGL